MQNDRHSSVSWSHAPGHASRATHVTPLDMDMRGRELSCVVCGGKLREIRGKLQCTRCFTIFETCWEGGRG